MTEESIVGIKIGVAVIILAILISIFCATAWSENLQSRIY